MELYQLILVLTFGVYHVRGEDYMLFYGGMKERSPSDPINVDYSMSSTYPNQVDVTGPGLGTETKTVDEKTVYLESLNKDMIPEDGKETSKSILLSTKGPMSIYAHMYTNKQGMGTMMALHDIGSDCREFVLASAAPKNNYQSQVTVAAREDSNIKILDSNSKQLETQSLRARQIYTFKKDGDLTGYRVVADTPVGVISMVPCSDMSDRSPPDCDPVSAYIPPVDRLGKLYVIPQILGKDAFNGNPAVARVVSATDDTKVSSYETLTAGVVQRTTLRSGEHYDLEITGNTATYLECSKGCLVSMLMKPFAPKAPYPGTSTDKVSGPLMVLVPDIWMAATDIFFHVPSFNDAVLYSLTIITRKASKDLLQLNDKPMTGVAWSDVGAMPFNISGTIRLNSKAGNYRINSVNNSIPFIAYLFVHGPDSSYGGSLNTYQVGGIPGLVTPTTTEEPPKTSTSASDRPSFTLAPDPSKPSTPTTTISTTQQGPKTTPTVESKTVVPPKRDEDFEYEDPIVGPRYTRRPAPTATTGIPTKDNSARWKIAVIVVVFLLAIVAVVVIGYFLVRRRARAREKQNSYMGQAMAAFTADGMVDSRVTMGEPRPQIDPNQGKQTIRGRLQNMRQLFISGFETVRAKRTTTEA